MKIRVAGAEIFHADRQTEMDRHGEPNIRFSQFCERANKKKWNTITIWRGNNTVNI
jgi:hypothetical protein